MLKDCNDIATPKIHPDVKHVFHLYVIRTDKRDQLQKYLKENGVSTGIHYPTPLPFLKAYDYLGHKVEDFPLAGSYKDQILSLPIFPEMTKEQIEYICNKVRVFFS